jgi:serine phosphatase RsbU (regulator of sigma subunit)/pSer/pThr/pTyr-binding forkhead associated (FHA) protein
MFWGKVMSKPKPLRSQPIVPTLELISGNQVSQIFEIRGADFHIGRTRGSECQLDDSKVSRNHARVERRSDGSCYLVDLNSQNNSYVDGQKLTPFQPFRLRDACRIKIVDFELVFRAPAVGLRSDEEERSTVQRSIDDLSSIRLARRLKQPAEAFRAILDVVQALGGTDLDEKLGRALDGLMAVFPRAERGFILTVEPDGAFFLRAVRHRGGPGEAPCLSQTIVRQVLEECKAILISDATIDEDYKGQESVASSLRTALVVPLAGSDGKPVGMVQLDSRAAKEGFTAVELDLLAALAVPLGVAVENHTLHKKKASWAAAGQIQRALLPKRQPDIAGYTFWECYRPVEEVGGDLYDYIRADSPQAHERGETRWAVVAGDVAGKGMPAALMMAGICPEVRHLTRAGVIPEEVLTRVNHLVSDADFDCRFVTLAIAELDSRSHRLRIASAGHPWPLIRRSDGRVEAAGTDETSTPLGINADEVFQSVTVSLEPGDVMILYSDGVPDALDRRNQRFGEKRLREELAQAPRGVAAVGEAVLAAVNGHASGRPQFDDITLVCFGRNE